MTTQGYQTVKPEKSATVVLVEVLEIFILAIDVLPGRTFVIGEIVREELSTVRAPQLSASEASSNGDIIDFGVVLTITCFGATALRAVTDHDSIDKVLAVGDLLERLPKFGHKLRRLVRTGFHDGCLLFPSRLPLSVGFPVRTTLCRFRDFLLTTPANHHKKPFSTLV
jgi:hypothetical protein